MTTASRGIQSIEVGLRVLRALEAADGPRPLKQIAAEAGMPASKAHLYMASFVREGMAVQDPATGYYGLGPFALELGLSALRQLDLVALARDELAALCDHAGGVAHLTVWGNRGPAIVARRGRPREGWPPVQVGDLVTLLGSAAGRVFLTYLPEAQTAAVVREESEGPRGGDRAPLPPEEAAKIREGVRARGYAANPSPNYVAVSAPVFDFSGQIAGVLTMIGAAAALSGTGRAAAVQAVLDACGRLSARLGRRTGM